MAEPQQIALVRQELPVLQAILQLTAPPGTDTLTLAQQEILYLEQQCLTKPEILQCEVSSIIMAIKGVLKDNLTLDPNAGLIYITTRNVKVGNDWKKMLVAKPTANGIISINRQAGRILDYTFPKVTKNDKGRVIGVSMQILVPSFTESRWQEVEYDESDFRRWMSYSHKENARSYKEGSGKPAPNLDTLNYANKLYTSFNGGIDPEFARSKCVRHGLSRLGTNRNERIIKWNIPNDRVVDPEVDAQGDDENHVTEAEVVNTTINKQPESDQEPEINVNDL